MINERVFIALPLNFKNKCSVYPPLIKEVIENNKFPLYKKLLTLSQEDIEDEFNEKNLDVKDLLTPLEYLLNTAYNDKRLEALARETFKFFIHENVHFLYE